MNEEWNSFQVVSGNICPLNHSPNSSYERHNGDGAKGFQGRDVSYVKNPK